MQAARRWIRRQRRGTERAGLVASSSAQRLKPRAIDIRVNIAPVHWFLSPPRDTRSSLYLEDVATQFQVQGLVIFVSPGAQRDRTRDGQPAQRRFPHRSADGLSLAVNSQQVESELFGQQWSLSSRHNHADF
jgi:hypothetical protein